MNSEKLEAIKKLENLRKRLFTQIRANLKEDGHCKSTEGEFRIVYPDYHEVNNESVEWAIELYCYVVGPKRSYCWVGNTLMEAVEKAEKEINNWIKEECKFLIENGGFTKADISLCNEEVKNMLKKE